MKSMTDKFYEFLARPLFGWSRIALAVLAIPLVLSFSAPLWRISMTAPQYPKGLHMDVYAYKLVGGEDGLHIAEINTLNHYIGMRKLDDAASADLDWIPFALGALVLFTLRVATIGAVSQLVDLAVMTAYVSLFAFGRFVYRLWVFGHELDPKAPVKVEPFMPVVFGHKTVANFETYSLPQLGSYYLMTFVVGVFLLAFLHLFLGRKKALREGG